MLIRMIIPFLPHFILVTRMVSPPLLCSHPSGGFYHPSGHPRGPRWAHRLTLGWLSHRLWSHGLSSRGSSPTIDTWIVISDRAVTCRQCCLFLIRHTMGCCQSNSSTKGSPRTLGVLPGALSLPGRSSKTSRKSLESG